MGVADDYPAINRRLREAQQERGNQGDRPFVLPLGMRIMIWESWETSRLTSREVNMMDLCLMLRQQLLILVKSRTGTLKTVRGIDVFAFLQQHFPSAQRTTDRKIVLSESDATRLRSLIDHTPW